MVSLKLITESDNRPFDDNSHFQDTRYLSVSEALWGLYRFDNLDRSPPDVQLDANLENSHILKFGDSQEGQAAQRMRAVRS